MEDISFNIHTGAVSSNTSKKKFLTIEQWTDAFNIYASVRRLKYPEEAEGLAAYMGVVRRIAQERGSWHFYNSDEHLNGREYEMAVNPLVNVLAIGHSFIRRLRDDILSRAYNDLHDNFGLNQCIVHFLHEGTILPDYDNFLYSVNNKILAIRFHDAVIQIGGNDIDNGCCPLLLASKLQDFANWLKD